MQHLLHGNRNDSEDITPSELIEEHIQELEVLNLVDDYAAFLQAERNKKMHSLNGNRGIGEDRNIIGLETEVDTPLDNIYS
jgi:hypothetical protein